MKNEGTYLQAFGVMLLLLVKILSKMKTMVLRSDKNIQLLKNYSVQDTYHQILVHLTVANTKLVLDKQILQLDKHH
jgi:hypothetical protein